MLGYGLGQPMGWHPSGMLGGLVRLLLYRVLGARVMLGLALLGFARRLLRGRRDATRQTPSTYQPSQGESQIVQREPRYRLQPRSRSVS